MVRAKFKINSITRTTGGKYDESGKWTACEVWSVKMFPVAGTSEENKKFWAATPGGQIELTCVNKEAVDSFDLNKEYYVDFTEADNG